MKIVRSYLTVAGSWMAALNGTSHRLFLNECDNFIFESTCLLSSIETRSSSDLNTKQQMKSTWLSSTMGELQQKYTIIMEGEEAPNVFNPKNKEQQAENIEKEAQHMTEQDPEQEAVQIMDNYDDDEEGDLDHGDGLPNPEEMQYEDVDPDDCFGESSSSGSSSESTKPLVAPAEKKAKIGPKVASPAKAKPKPKGKHKANAKSKRVRKVRANKVT